jgi:segregation and condensation protein B
MSLKAKLEAVIYAAEEPVTLAQLALLFTADALEWKAEREAAAAESSVPFEGTGESLPPQNEEFDYLALDQNLRQNPDQSTAATEPEAADAAGVEPVADSIPDEAEEERSEPGSGAEGETPASDEAAAQASLRRKARLRDKEVRGILHQLLAELIATYASDNRGVEIREIAGGYRMATKPECHDAVRAFVKSLKPPLKLSLPALETLAVIAYKQPVTGPEVNEIRGVDSSAVFGSLMARKLITTAGRKPVIGRPILYKTTKEFLLRFGLKDVTELPSMEEFEKMAAIELDEPEFAGQGGAAPEIREDLSLELDGTQGEEPAAEATESPEGESTTPEAAPAAPPPTE